MAGNSLPITVAGQADKPLTTDSYFPTQPVYVSRPPSHFQLLILNPAGANRKPVSLNFRSLGDFGSSWVQSYSHTGTGTQTLTSYGTWTQVVYGTRSVTVSATCR